MAASDLVVIEDGAVAIVIDERSWPILTSTWFGSATESLVVAFFKHVDGQLDRAQGRGEKLVMITDTYATSPPSAKVRQKIAELSRVQSVRSEPLVLESMTVIESVLIRGVVTALSWVDPSMARTKNVASFDAALAGALAAMEAAGLPRPAVLPVRQANPVRASRTG